MTHYEREEDVHKDLMSELINIPSISIYMKSTESCLLGISESETIEITLRDVLKFHGYCAGGVAFAFRAAMEAFKVLCGDELPVRQSFKVQTAYHCCQAGALSYITGARTDFGAKRSNGDLELIPKKTGKIIFTQKNTGKKVTLEPSFNPHDIFEPLFQGIRNEPELASEVRKILQEAIVQYVSAPSTELFTIIKFLL